MYQGFGFCFVFVCGFLFLPWQFSNLSVEFYNHIYKHGLYWGDSFNTAEGKGRKTITSNQKQQGALQRAGSNFWDGSVWLGSRALLAHMILGDIPSYPI